MSWRRIGRGFKRFGRGIWDFVNRDNYWYRKERFLCKATSEELKEIYGLDDGAPGGGGPRPAAGGQPGGIPYQIIISPNISPQISPNFYNNNQILDFDAEYTANVYGGDGANGFGPGHGPGGYGGGRGGHGGGEFHKGMIDHLVQQYLMQLRDSDCSRLLEGYCRKIREIQDRPYAGVM